MLCARFFCFYMIHLGNYNTLEVLRSTSVGVFLGDGEGTEVLLPNKYVPDGIDLGQEIKVFCYLDHMERPIATTLEPLIIRDGFAKLKVMEVNDFGAFVDWGLEKQLLVPFRQQQIKLEAGKYYVIHCYLDEKSFRLVGSTKIDKFLNNDQVGLEINQEVDLMVYKKTDLGLSVIINQRYQGLVFSNDVFKNVRVGDQLKGYIKNIRPDNKIDVTLQPIGVEALDFNANKVLELVKNAGGYLPLHDKSEPEAIKESVQLSKKAFKKAIGILYKKRLITIDEEGITLNAED